MVELPIEEILASSDDGSVPGGISVGRSRLGSEIEGFALGSGSLRVSLIAECHADEPVGPKMLERLLRFLAAQARNSPLLTQFSWLVIPHVNPDGASRNEPWTLKTLHVQDHRGGRDRAYDPVLFARHVERELPGDDIEFGFPRTLDDLAARPENLAVARFLSTAAPLHLHGSFHGMGFAPGPWFLLEPAWIERTETLRRSIREQVHAMGYPLFDFDRKGEKGFRRIDEGFSTRPDSGAMIGYFRSRDDESTAMKFRPSSMEFARGLGGDPLTMVSEMPLFLLLGGDTEAPLYRPGTDGKRELHDMLQRLATDQSPEEARSEMERLGILPMPIRDQMRLQLAFLREALSCVAEYFGA